MIHRLLYKLQSLPPLVCLTPLVCPYQTHLCLRLPQSTGAQTDLCLGGIHLGHQPTSDRRFTYDGWNVIMEDEWVTAKTRTYAWGLDIQGSLQGAAGVGGLVAVHDKIENLSGKLLLPGYDANGNVAVMVNGTNGDLEAAYEYGPFGESLRQEGPSAKVNPFRFSTKYTDDETGLNYYGRRYYDPRNGRFLGRDLRCGGGGDGADRVRE